MIEKFYKENFQTMPWKNGGGITTEIFRIPAHKSDTFFFRLSRAGVSSDGPFSLFPGIDRVLLLIEGNGMRLHSRDRNIELNTRLSPVSFKGEEAFSCSLINGPCVDFNVMTDRSYANSTISVMSAEDNAIFTAKAECDLKFIYDIGNEILTRLEKSDQCEIRIAKGFPLIVIDITLL